MFIEESKLEKLLIKAYEEGWYGSKDLAQEASSKIIANFQNEQTQNEKQARKKKPIKKVRRKVPVGSGPWSNYVNPNTRPSNDAVANAVENARARYAQPLDDSERPQYARQDFDRQNGPAATRPPSNEEILWHQDQAERRNGPVDQSEDWGVDAAGHVYGTGRPPLTTYREHREEMNRQAMRSMAMPDGIEDMPSEPDNTAPVEEAPHDNASASSQMIEGIPSNPVHNISSAEIIQGMLFGPGAEEVEVAAPPSSFVPPYPSVAEEMEMSEGDIQDWAEESEESARMEVAAMRFSADHPTDFQSQTDSQPSDVVSLEDVSPRTTPRASQEMLDDVRSWGHMEVSIGIEGIEGSDEVTYSFDSNFNRINPPTSMGSSNYPPVVPDEEGGENPPVIHEGWSNHELFTWMDGSVHNMPESQGGG